MDGKVLSQAFVKTPNVAFIPSWEKVPGADGRHPPHTRLDPVAAHEALEQMIALGYIERPDENREIAVNKTIRELRYNLCESYQDAGRHIEAHEVFTELYATDRDEQRFAVRLFVSCQALGMHEEMRRIVDDLDGRRRALYEEAKARIDDVRDTAEPLHSDNERRDLARWRNLARYEPAVVDYLRAQILTAERRYAEALAALERVTDADPLQTADLHLRLGHMREAQQACEKALAIDPDNAHAHLGLCRLALRQRKFNAAAQSALDALQRSYQNPPAHFLLGLALTGMENYERAAEALRAAISFNPNFPEAHVRLAALLEKHLGDGESAREHRRLARRMRSRANTTPVRLSVMETMEIPVALSTPKTVALPPPEECLVVVTGLPRSGTSMLMQMLAAGGMRVLSDGLREPDEDNPRGYLEFEPVKNLLKDSKWLFEARGRAVKIVAPLLTALPPGLACRVILSERDLDAVLDSQERMLARRKQPLAATPERRRMLIDEYARTLGRVKAMLARRPCTQLLVIEHSEALANPLAAAEKLNTFLGGGLDVAKMAAVIDATLQRARVK
jgi:tetratricopeptide (TPR) repeat protein